MKRPGSSPDSVRAVYMNGPNRPLETRRLPAPEPRERGAILETVASEVCGTDVHLLHGRLRGVPYPAAVFMTKSSQEIPEESPAGDRFMY